MKDVQNAVIDKSASAGRVGKTSLALRFVHNTFNHSQQASLQASFLTKQITAGNQQVCCDV
jgi:GTPase SAR1 family protein